MKCMHEIHARRVDGYMYGWESGSMSDVRCRSAVYRAATSTFGTLALW